MKHSRKFYSRVCPLCSADQHQLRLGQLPGLSSPAAADRYRRSLTTRVDGVTGIAIAVTPIPEPSTYALATIGILAILAIRRRNFWS